MLTEGSQKWSNKSYSLRHSQDNQFYCLSKCLTAKGSPSRESQLAGQGYLSKCLTGSYCRRQPRWVYMQVGITYPSVLLLKAVPVGRPVLPIQSKCLTAEGSPVNRPGLTLQVSYCRRQPRWVCMQVGITYPSVLLLKAVPVGRPVLPIQVSNCWRQPS